MSLPQFQCQKHSKSLQILVINQAKYICQDCAIFQSEYRQQQLLQKQSIGSHITHIKKNCSQLVQLQKANRVLTHTNLKSILQSIETLQDQLINDINRQFCSIRTKVSNAYLINVQVEQQERNLKGKENFTLLMKQTIPQLRLKKHALFEKDLIQYRIFLNTQSQKINHFYLRVKQQLQSSVCCKVNLKDAFNQVLTSRTEQKNPMVPQKDDENLLDFTEFYIQRPVVQPQFTFREMVGLTFDSVSKFDKNQQVQRMKTAQCLESSVCSIESSPKSNQAIIFDLKIDQSTHYVQSLLSQRSVSCTSTISSLQKHQFPSTILSCNLIKQPPKKTTIQVNTIQQLHSKLLSISPHIKTIRISNLPITTQQLIFLLKFKISRSFIHTLEIISCPKVNEKILLQLKNHRCRTLKKIEFKQCKQMNFNEKKAREIIKKLQSDGIKVRF